MSPPVRGVFSGFFVGRFFSMKGWFSGFSSTLYRLLYISWIDWFRVVGGGVCGRCVVTCCNSDFCVVLFFLFWWYWYGCTDFYRCGCSYPVAIDFYRFVPIVSLVIDFYRWGCSYRGVTTWTLGGRLRMLSRLIPWEGKWTLDFRIRGVRFWCIPLWRYEYCWTKIL